MKIAISSEGDNLSSNVDSRFGRARYFVVVDTESMNYKAIDNTAASSAGGAGTKAAQLLLDEGVDSIISSNVGPNALEVFQAAGITVYKSINDTIEKNVKEFKKGTLEKIEFPTNNGHHGEH
ncbi:NifB/NifX family molybdenum-iron cluster-binding protein [Thermoanaerobacterium sp. CMT5567-10]|uniref:NifB/NifX family molybdenum-iron cluster-binding protein n=1 Tax=Thermoanaerobacterium sp. CMT5567-10 TaxID=3061989 RepID=UPI0026DFEFB0|nr:NifB/NifX family molybdenum-iron cluster-binding protein [Thermoanaerobacterium sp. CMT5567-10]WKV09633.1 NifB/NifX family molybdenum-iron cluster-binding protein [Thermoanaerobacterium sp. CMT5567-10]